MSASPASDSRATGTIYFFGPFRLVPTERRLERDGHPVTLGSRALDILIALAERPGEVLGKSELLRKGWPDLTVDESNLRFHIVGLRKALGDGTGGRRYIVNVPGRGYCLATATQHVATMPSQTSQLGRQPLLPVLDRIVGRDAAIHDIVQTLRTHRFVTILGAGGAGKTTLAIAVTHQLAGDYGDDILFVDLGDLADPTLVASTLATALAIDTPSSDPTAEIIDDLRERRRLIVLDGCEHVVDEVAKLAEQIYLQAPQVGILATSRERLRVEGERTIPLSGLAHPSLGECRTLEEAMRFPAVCMLIERARAAGYVGTIGDADAGCVAGICRTLDGLPLAIELAASRVAEYGWSETARLLEGRHRLIWSGRRTAPARHQTLQSAIEWSYDRLDPIQKMIFARLAIFSGPFQLTDAMSLTLGDDLTATEIAGVLQSLVEKSLLAVVRDGQATSYRLLDTMRAFACLKLDAGGDRQAAAGRHAPAEGRALGDVALSWLWEKRLLS
nr:winged helix-turn-helix domain-containing protein [Pleomorphomonas oryzae]